MAQQCFFDGLPVELLHTLFAYFDGQEIVFTFCDISNYVNAILQTYSEYRLNFQSISKFNFNFVCEHIRAEQVISLTLSDGRSTPGQSDLFFSYFRIEQFIHLRSLTLLEIQFNSLESIFINLPQLHELRSFSFDARSIRHEYGPIDLNSKNKLQQTNIMLLNAYAQVLPQLNFLYLNGGWVLDSIPLPNLHHLTLPSCSLEQLETISSLAPQLKSLDVCLKYGWLDPDSMPIPSQLTRLSLKIEVFFNAQISMDDIELLLANRRHLKHLKLIIDCYCNLADGQRWQAIVASLITFSLKFHVRLLSIEETLDSFRTSFWLEEKQWFVAYQNECLFSIPYFARKQVTNSSQSPIYSTVPDNKIFFEYITELTIVEGQTMENYFHHISVLKLDYFITNQDLLATVDFHQVKQLSILSLDQIIHFLPITVKMPQLSKLSVKNGLTRQVIERVKHSSYEQIRTLELGIDSDHKETIMEDLCRLFPHIEHFIYRSRLESARIMMRFINNFKHLLNASFRSYCSFFNEEYTLLCHPQLTISKTNRITYGKSICRIYHSSDDTSLYSVDWWLDRTGHSSARLKV